MDFHFVSNGCFVVEAELNMPRGVELDRCLIFRGKQTHTGTRHGCHISLSFPVSPRGQHAGQPLCSGPAMEIYICRNRYAFAADSHKRIEPYVAVVGADIACHSLEITALTFQVEYEHILLPKLGSIFNFPRLISDCAGAKTLYSFTSARRSFSGFQ